MTGGIVEMQDKLIISIHNKARKRYEELLRATIGYAAGLWCKSSQHVGYSGLWRVEDQR
jgi:hypothetical protein